MHSAASSRARGGRLSVFIAAFAAGLLVSWIHDTTFSGGRDLQNGTLPAVQTTTEASTVCATGWDWSWSKLECPPGKLVNDIVFASYGSPTGECHAFKLSNNHVDFRGEYHALCAGKKGCRFYSGLLEMATSVSYDRSGNHTARVEAVCTTNGLQCPTCYERLEPRVWQYMIDTLKARSWFVIGCHQPTVDWLVAHQQDVACLDIAGSGGSAPSVLRHDFTRGPFVPKRAFDVVWFLGLDAMVDPRALVPAFKAAKHTLVSFSMSDRMHPGAGAARLEEVLKGGMEIDRKLTQELLPLAAESMEIGHYPDFKLRGLALRRQRWHTN